MAVDVPQGSVGGGGGDRPFNGPNKPGRYTGQQVRYDGWVWDYDPRRGDDGWAPMRETRASDIAAIPPVGVGLAPGYKKGDWQREQQANQDTDTPPASGGGGGGGGGGGSAGGGGGGGGNAGGGSGGGGATDKDTLRGIPDAGRIWQVGDNYYAVYKVPNSKPPIYLSYRFRDKAEAMALSTGKGIDVTRKLTPEEFRRTGAIPSGPVDLIVNQSEHPWDRFNQDFKREVRYKPWLADPDFMALIARSILEGREPTLSEIQDTDWYQEHTADERQKLELYYGDRATWNAERDRWAKVAQEKLEAAGFDRTGRGRVGAYLAGELMFGRLTEADLDREIERISNPLANHAAGSAGLDAPERGRAVRVDGEVFWRVRGPNGGVMDYRMTDIEEAKYGGQAVEAQRVFGNSGTGVKGFGGLLREDGGGVDYRQTVEGFDATRQTVLDEIGPVLARTWGEGRIARWAQAIKENPAREQELKRMLAATRRSHYQNYDPELNYRAIADIGQAQAYTVLGTQMDESDPIFQQVLQANDQARSAQILTEYGLQTGKGKVTQAALAGLSAAMDGGVRRSMV